MSENRTVSGMQIDTGNALENQIRHAAKRLTIAHHPELRDVAFETQVQRYMDFGLSVSAHLGNVAEHYRKLAEELQRITPSRPIVFDPSELSPQVFGEAKPHS